MQVTAPQETSGSTPPWWRVRVSYQEIETTQLGTDVSETLGASVADYYSRKRRVVVATDADVKIRFPLAIDGPEFPGVLESETDASTLAQSLLAIYKIPRRTWSVKIGPRAGGVRWWELPIGSTVTLIWPGIPTLAGGKQLLVRGISARGDSAELELWG